MILSSSYEVTLVLLAAAMFCWGLWANTLKATSRWRYELYYFDFAAGFALFAAVFALTLGSLNSKELTFQDNFAIAGYRKIAYCLVAGFVFGLGTNLLTAGIALAGMAVAFILSMGTGAAIGTTLAIFAGTDSGVVLESVGIAAILAAVGVAAYTHTVRADVVREAAENAPLRPDPRDLRSKKESDPPPAHRGILIGILSGIFMGVHQPLLDMGRQGDDGVGPYGAALLFGTGLLTAAVFLLPIFCNFPVRGRSLHIRDYFKTSASNHILGVLGGLIGISAIVATLVAQAAPRVAQPGPAFGFAFVHLGAVVAALCGLLFWREFRATEGRTVMLFASSVVLFAVGIAMAAFGQT